MSDNSSVDPECSTSPAGVNLAMAFNVTRVCLPLPLSIFILFLAYRQWQQQGSFRTMSHADMLTYHNAALELVCNLVTAAYVYGTYSEIFYLRIAGWWFCCLALYGEILFHPLTRVERYLAVVHPVTYRALRNGRGVRIRNIGIGCAWLLCMAGCTASSWEQLQMVTTSTKNFSIQVLCVLGFSLLVISFCSISILRALVGPGPGVVEGVRERVDQLKRRAFVTIMAITAVLWLSFVGLVIGFALELSFHCSHVSLVPRASGYWFMMPGSLVLPLLYLHRTGQIRCS